MRVNRAAVGPRSEQDGVLELSRPEPHPLRGDEHPDGVLVHAQSGTPGVRGEVVNRHGDLVKHIIQLAGDDDRQGPGEGEHHRGDEQFAVPDHEPGDDHQCGHQRQPGTSQHEQREAQHEGADVHEPDEPVPFHRPSNDHDDHSCDEEVGEEVGIDHERGDLAITAHRLGTAQVVGQVLASAYLVECRQDGDDEPEEPGPTHRDNPSRSIGGHRHRSHGEQPEGHAKQLLDPGGAGRKHQTEDHPHPGHHEDALGDDGQVVPSDEYQHDEDQGEQTHRGLTGDRHGRSPGRQHRHEDEAHREQPLTQSCEGGGALLDDVGRPGTEIPGTVVMTTGERTLGRTMLRGVVRHVLLEPCPASVGAGEDAGSSTEDTTGRGGAGGRMGAETAGHGVVGHGRLARSMRWLMKV